MTNIANMNTWLIDTNVLIIFFVRDDVLKKTFESVRKARPRRLLLWQDGAREGRHDDIEGIERCRRIVENIDWDCEVYSNYQIKNLGCDPSTFYAHKWAFSIVDKCIILEDDCVPSQSFYRYCAELLVRYEHDQRINRICGVCNLADYDTSYSYLFCNSGSGPGFATWRRVADLWISDYSFLQNKEGMRLLNNKYNSSDDKKYIKTCIQHRDEGVEHWETIYSFTCYLNNQLVIIPTKNLVKNIGLGVDSTHTTSTFNQILPSLRQITFQDSYEIEFPLKHLPYVIEDVEYDNRRKKILGKSSYTNFLYVKVLSVLWRFSHGAAKAILKKIFVKVIEKLYIR